MHLWRQGLLRLLKELGNKMKKIFFTIIIVVGLGGALVMGYMAMQSGSSTPDSSETSTPKSPKSSILPEGTELDFDKVSDFNKGKTVFPYPKVIPLEIGVGLPNIVE